MLISREELRFDFQGAKFDLNSGADLELLGWIFNQFLYGEVTGIQCGHWLYHAPHLSAATFLAKQASEELSHVRKILRVLSLLRQKPRKAHWAIRFLATGMMGASWGEHVALEMALGEGLVLGIFYAMADTIPHPEIEKILNSAAVEEERHVEYGEREALRWLESSPRSRKLWLVYAEIQLFVLGRLKKQVLKKLSGQLGNAHPITLRFEPFYDHLIRTFERRMKSLGMMTELEESRRGLRQGMLLLSFPFLWMRERFRLKRSLLTESYLEDPILRAEVGRGGDLQP